MSIANADTGSGNLVGKSGKRITVGRELRIAIKDKRESLGLTQKEFAAQMRVSAGTISNLETGQHPQVSQDLYIRLKRVLTLNGDSTLQTSQIFEEIVDGVLELDERSQRIVNELIKSLKK